MPKGLEASHQAALFQWLKLYPLINELAWHTPNGGFRNKAEACAFKRMGVKPGVPDVFIAIPLNGYNGLFIELKSKDGKLTEYQVLMHANLKRQNYEVSTCYTWFEAKDAILKYFIGSDYVKLRAIS